MRSPLARVLAAGVLAVVLFFSGCSTSGSTGAGATSSGTTGSAVASAALFDATRGVPVLVVTFIALLELGKETLIEITQAEAFAPIYVRLAYTPA